MKMTLRLSLLALALLLAGCPQAGPETQRKTEPTDPTGEAPGPDQPAVTINTLGLVKATILASSFTVGLPTYRLSLADLGDFVEKNDSFDPAYYRTTAKPWPDAPGYYVSGHPSDYTHGFKYLTLADHVETLEVTLGSQPATSRRLVKNDLLVNFPPEAEGELVMKAPAGSSLRFMRLHALEYQPGVYGNFYSFDTERRIPPEGLDAEATYEATASLTVAVNELDGTPCAGLKASHFTVATIKYSYVKGKVLGVTETSTGVYQLTAKFEGLYGQKALDRNLSLRVGSPTFQQEVTP